MRPVTPWHRSGDPRDDDIADACRRQADPEAARCKEHPGRRQRDNQDQIEHDERRHPYDAFFALVRIGLDRNPKWRPRRRVSSRLTWRLSWRRRLRRLVDLGKLRRRIVRIETD